MGALDLGPLGQQRADLDGAAVAGPSSSAPAGKAEDIVGGGLDQPGPRRGSSPWRRMSIRTAGRRPRSRGCGRASDTWPRPVVGSRRRRPPGRGGSSDRPGPGRRRRAGRSGGRPAGRRRTRSLAETPGEKPAKPTGPTRGGHRRGTRRVETAGRVGPDGARRPLVPGPHRPAPGARQAGPVGRERGCWRRRSAAASATGRLVGRSTGAVVAVSIARPPTPGPARSACRTHPSGGRRPPSSPGTRAGAPRR